MKPNRMLLKTLFIAAMMIATPLYAQQPAKVPILNDATYLLVRVDFKKIDFAALQTWLDEGVRQWVPKEAQAGVSDQLGRGMTEMEKSLRSIINAGSSVAYISMSSVPPEGPILYLAADTGKDPAALADAVSGVVRGPGRARQDLNNVSENTEVIEPLAQGVFVGPLKDLRAFQQNAVGAPQLTFRLTTLSDSAVQAVVMPSAPMVQVLEAMPDLPAPLSMPMTTITQGITSITATLDLPPKLSLHVKIEAADAENAKALSAAIDRSATLMTSPEVQQQAPNVDLKKIATLLTPKLQPDNTLTITIDDPADQQTLGKIVSSFFIVSRDRAVAAQSASVLRQYCMGVIMYRQQKNAFPDSLAQIGAAGIMNIAALKNPRGTTPADDYIYRKPTDNPPVDFILLYENPDDLAPGTESIFAGFPDGHIESMPPADLKAKIAGK